MVAIDTYADMVRTGFESTISREIGQDLDILFLGCRLFFSTKEYFYLKSSKSIGLIVLTLFFAYQSMNIAEHHMTSTMFHQ